MVYDKKYLTLPLLLAVSSCQQGVELDVSQKSAGAPISLSVVSRSSNFTACIDTARIYPAERVKDLLWEVGRSDQGRCIQAVSVGLQENGFVQRLHVSSSPDGTYCAEVRGPGFTAWRRFTIRNKVAVQDGKSEGYC